MTTKKTINIWKNMQNFVLLAAAEECHQSLTLETEVKINAIYIQLCSKKKSEEKLPLNFRYIRRGIKTYKIREKDFTINTKGTLSLY